MRVRGTCSFPIAMGLLAMALISDAISADFRVETDVFAAEQAQPVQQSLTLFVDGVAYDYSLGDPSHVTIVDVAQQKITLLDTEREVQSQVSLSDLNALMESAKNQAATTGLAVYLADANIVDVDQANNRVTVGEKQLQYTAKLEVLDDATMVSQYRQFADATANLNAWLSAAPPPFARVALNAAIGNRSALPSEISRTAFAFDSKQKTGHVVRCRLHTSRKLSEDDRTRIEEFRRLSTQLALVPIGEFVEKPEEVASRTPQNANK